MARIGINGFGRIGRVAMRIALKKEMTIAAINEPTANVDYLAYLFKYDSTYGRFKNKVCVKDGQLVIQGMPIKVYKESDPAKIPWKDAGAEFILECSGKQRSKEKAGKHLKAGAKKVIVSAPAKDVPTFVYGVNLDKYKPGMNILSNASCATHGLAPLAKVIDEKFQICKSLMTTVHAATGSQMMVDMASSKDKREGRAVLGNIIPGATGAATEVLKVLPHLAGKCNAIAIRVPLAKVSLCDYTCLVSKSTCLEEIKQEIKCASKGKLKGILGYTEDKVVSTDFMGDHRSAVFDVKASMELNKNFFKLITWFDNEYGYAARLIDLCIFAHKVDEKDRKAKEKAKKKASACKKSADSKDKKSKAKGDGKGKGEAKCKDKKKEKECKPPASRKKCETPVPKPGKGKK